MTYIFGHKNPDTDSICGSISLSYLKNKLGDNTEPRALGDINNETKFVLDYFNINIPKYINDVKLQIKDLDYNKGCFLNYKQTIKEAYNYMADNNISGLPIVDGNNKLLSLLSLKDLTKVFISDDSRRLVTSYDNILSTLDAREVLRFDDEIKGRLLTAAFRSSTFVEHIKLNENDILIVGDRNNILEYAIRAKIKLVILVGDGTLSENNYNLAKEHGINVIKTNLDTYSTNKLIYLSNYVENILTNSNPITLEENDYFTTYKEIFAKTNHTNYPVVDKDSNCLGLMSTRAADKKNLKKVILVDHNEINQTADGIDEANIVEIVDHHKLDVVPTNNPISFRNMPVGSTNTIIYFMFKENDIEIPKDIAGIMLAAILSDTLLFKSPTTTDIDKKVAVELEKIVGVDINEFGFKMFKAGSSLKNKTKDEVIFTDFKKFNYGETDIGVGQIMTMDIDSIMNDIDEYVDALNEIALNDGYAVAALFITDVIKNGSYVLFNDGSKSILEDSFKVENLQQGHYFDGIVSRKKQIIPNILEFLSK